MPSNKQIWTIGHSTRSFNEFAELLQLNNIHYLVDVRRYPGSKKFPHFNKEQLSVLLPEINITYHHIHELGGRRKALKDSVNTAWRLASFRAYADYMQSKDFLNAMLQLMELAQKENLAYMCSEAVWWSCHRALISDYLKVRNWKVFHIMGKKNISEHPFTSAARVENNKLFYN